MPPASRVRLVLLGGLVLLTAGAGVPFLTTGGIDWAGRSGVFLSGTLALVAATWLHAVEAGRLRLVVPFTAWVSAVTWLIEAVDRPRGIWFGASWQYHDGLTPVLAGGIPAAIPLAWYVFAYAPVALLRRFGADRSARRRRRVMVKTGLAALCLVGIDLLVDPLVVSTGAWTWAGGGAWFGVPWSNFAGWFATGVVIFLPVFALEPPVEADDPPGARRADAMLAAGGVLFFALVAFVSVLRLGSGWPAVAAAAAMTPAAGAFARRFW